MCSLIYFYSWQKRDYPSGYKDRDTAKPSFGKRRHELSPDSRSRSPARSIYSRRSSNRSRSRSISPKRRKRSDESSAHANFIPVTKKNNNSRRSRSPDWSTGPLAKPRRANESKTRIRRTSISSRSSPSRSRSRSSSETPDTRPKPKHRLPTATSLRDIEMQAKSLRLSANVPARQSADLNNGPLTKRANKSEQPMVCNSIRLFDSYSTSRCSQQARTDSFEKGTRIKSQIIMRICHLPQFLHQLLRLSMTHPQWCTQRS